MVKIILDIFNKIGERNLLIINVVLSLIYYSTYTNFIDLGDIIGWFFEAAGYNLVLTIALITRAFTKFEMKKWVTILSIHWAIQILVTWAENYG